MAMKKKLIFFSTSKNMWITMWKVFLKKRLISAFN